MVESSINNRMPSLEASDPSRAKSVRRSSTGLRSILKSPECSTTPCGVCKATAKVWGIECVTGMNSTSNGPIRRRSPSLTLTKVARWPTLAFVTLFLSSARVNSEP